MSILWENVLWIHTSLLLPSGTSANKLFHINKHADRRLIDLLNQIKVGVSDCDVEYSINKCWIVKLILGEAAMFATNRSNKSRTPSTTNNSCPRMKIDYRVTCHWSFRNAKTGMFLWKQFLRTFTQNNEVEATPRPVEFQYPLMMSMGTLRVHI